MYLISYAYQQNNITLLTLSISSEVGLSQGNLAKQESTKFRKSSDHSPPARVGGSFCAIWYKALIAFILKSGGLRSASSIQVIPSDHTSAFPSYCPSSMARITSGAIQYGVPTNELAGQHIDAEPKSAAIRKQCFIQYGNIFMLEYP